MENNKSHNKITMADFKAKIGKHQQVDRTTVRQFGYGNRKDRGTRLV